MSDSHTELSLDDVDELNRHNRTIMLRGVVIWSVLDSQERQGPDDDSDHPMTTLLREALTDLTIDIAQAARSIADVMARARKDRAS